MSQTHRVFRPERYRPRPRRYLGDFRSGLVPEGRVRVIFFYRLDINVSQNYLYYTNYTASEYHTKRLYLERSILVRGWTSRFPQIILSI